jgi:hypothetical protein
MVAVPTTAPSICLLFLFSVFNPLSMGLFFTVLKAKVTRENGWF